MIQRVIIVALVVEVFCLLMQLGSLPSPFTTAKERRSNAREVGHLDVTTNRVNLRPQGSLSWYNAEQGEPLYEGDSILTGPDSTASLRLKRGIRVTLLPNSLLQWNRIKQSQDPVSIRLAHGQMNLESHETPERIELNGAVLKIDRKSKVDIKAAGKKPEMYIAKGTLTVEKTKSGSSLLQLKKGESTSETASTIRWESLSPAPGEKVSLINHEIQLTWSSDGVDFIEISTSPNFFDSRKLPATDSALSLDLSPGRYYWRSTKGKQKSQTARFTLLPEINYTPLSPLASHEGDATKPVSFQWASEPELSLYHVQVAKNSTFGILLYDKQVEGKRLKMDPLPPGTYYWRLVGVHPELGYLALSRPFSFQIKQMALAENSAHPKPQRDLQSLKPPPLPQKLSYKTLAPREGQRLGSFQPGMLLTQQLMPVRLAWKPSPHATQYEIQVSRKNTFTSLLKSFQVKGTEAEASLKFPGLYYWRVRALNRSVGSEWTRPQLIVLE